MHLSSGYCSCASYSTFRCKAATEVLVNRENPAGICDLIHQCTGPAFKVQFAMCEGTDISGKRIFRVLCYRPYRSAQADDIKKTYEDVIVQFYAKLFTKTHVTITLEGQYKIDNENQAVALR